MSDSPSGIDHGFLVLADISGYTAFLSQTELEHAQEILSDLLETVVTRFKTMLTIHKIEGDAVFGYARDAQLVRGETLLELIEATYVDFRGRTTNVRRHSTCGCRACNSIPMLDLKFIVHHGAFALQSIGGTPELAGSDVNLVHRLLKNHISEQTGWSAYALLSQAGLQRMGLDPTDVVRGSESYEHLGTVEYCALDMHRRYDDLMSQRHVVVEPQDAAVSFSEEMPAPPPVVWSWMNEPAKRALYTAAPDRLRFMPILRPNGRTGVGATTHCIHGKNTEMRETVLDWKPFDYFTVEQDGGPFGIVKTTFRFEPIGSDRTRLTCRLTGRMRGLPAFLHRPLIRFIYTRLFNYHAVAIRARQILEAEPAVSSPEPTAPAASPAGVGL
jgi:hypothetical protein